MNFKWFFLIIFTYPFLNALSVCSFIHFYFFLAPLQINFLSLLFSSNYFQHSHFLSFHHHQSTFFIPFQIFFFLRIKNFHFWPIWFFNKSFSIDSKTFSVNKINNKFFICIRNFFTVKNIIVIKKTFSTIIGSSFLRKRLVLF